MKGSELEKFCTLKGLTREKSTWEVENREDIETKENELKEMLTKKKLAKSQKKKLELVRECMKILENVD